MPFPKEIDNTIREAFVVCPEKARRAYIEDLSPIQASVHLHFGGAFAAGLEATRRAYFEQSISPPEAIELGILAALMFWGDFDPPPQSNKTREALVEALRYYFEIWPLDTDPLRPKNIEWRFRVPLPGLVHPDDQGPIYYVGRSDAPGDLTGMYTIEDDKTASTLGPSWAKQWDLESQFTGYVWAAQELGLMPKDSSGPVLIRGVSILTAKFDEIETLDGHGEIVKVTGRAPNKIQRYFTKQYDRASSFGHAQALVYRPPWVVERWLTQVCRDVRRMIYAYENNEWDFALHKNACAAYGGCTFKDLCLSQDPESWIPINFTKRKWNPLEVV